MHQSAHVLDVHGLKVPEARSRVERALRDALLAGAPRLRVITGRGNHSVDGIPVLKARIIETMAEYALHSGLCVHGLIRSQVSHAHTRAPDEPGRTMDRLGGGGHALLRYLNPFRVRTL
jgi:DNA-nicking Smr family endonuclease